MQTMLSRVRKQARDIKHYLNDKALARKLSGLPRPVRTPDNLSSLEDRPTLVVMAHPDDEIIAAGALLNRVPRSRVITVTNGAPRAAFHAHEAGFSNWFDYAAARYDEAEAAFSLLTRKPELHGGAGVPDQDATLHLVSVVWHLVQHLRIYPQVITHAYEGGHPDHDATAFCVHAACALMSRAGASVPTIVEAPLYNAPGGKYRNQIFLPHPDAGTAVSMPLTASEQERKMNMFACHVSQGEILKNFHLREESFRTAPRYHFGVLPEAGLGYEVHRMPVNARVWRREVFKAMRALGLIEELA